MEKVNYSQNEATCYPIALSDVPKEKVFAKGFCFAKIFIIFIIGSIIGTYYEEILTLLQDGIWQTRQGVIYGPFNPLYGLGFALFVAVLGKNLKTRKKYLTYIYSCLLAGFVEYLISFMGDALIGVKSWDYSDLFLNIGGRTTIPFMLFWGLGGFLFLEFIYPFLSDLIEKIPYKIAKYSYPLLVAFMIVNMFLSYTALIRQSMRKEDIPAFTPIGTIYDKVYTDEFLSTIYTNMEYKKVN